LIDSNAYCTAVECDRETEEGRIYCPTHYKQVQRTGKTAPIAEKLTPVQRLHEAILALPEISSEDDRAYEIKWRQILNLCRSVGRNEQEPRSRGRPPKVKLDEVVQLVERLKGIDQVAAHLGVSSRTVRRALRRHVLKGSDKNRTNYVHVRSEDQG
jgi:uncharacterized Zn finger protein (UPF0148 family)